jgi:tRNA nucleotidyltransferase (CCA-adding enzyme)
MPLIATTQNNRARWEHFPHGADVGVRGIGASRDEAFVQAALALTAAVCEPERVKAVRKVPVSCEAADEQILLAAWLNTVIEEMSARKMLFSRFSLQSRGLRLSAVLEGEEVDRLRHAPAVEPKGATLTALRVARENGLWTAQCVVDV